MTNRRPEASELISELAHELKTPLAAITGFAELLRHRDDDHTRREAPRLIGEAAERLSKVVDDLVEILHADPELALRIARARKTTRLET